MVSQSPQRIAAGDEGWFVFCLLSAT